MSDDELKDSDEIKYEYVFDENFKEFSVSISSPKSMETSQIAAILIDFATALEAGDIPLFAADEIVTH